MTDALEAGVGKTSSSAGWKKNGKGWWYREADGSYPKDAWKKIGGEWYRFDSSGYMVTGWCEVGGKWYHLSSSGAMDTGWYKGGNLWYFLDSSGAMQTGWHKSVKGEWYWLDEETGAMAVGWKRIGGKWYLFDDEGGDALVRVRGARRFVVRVRLVRRHAGGVGPSLREGRHGPRAVTRRAPHRGALPS